MIEESSTAVHAMQLRAYLQSIDDPEEREIVVADLASLEADARRR